APRRLSPGRFTAAHRGRRLRPAHGGDRGPLGRRLQHAGAASPARRAHRCGARRPREGRARSRALPRHRVRRAGRRLAGRRLGPAPRPRRPRRRPRHSARVAALRPRPHPRGGAAPSHGGLMTTPIRVLGIAGSLRKASFNRGLLRAAGEMLPDGMSLDSYEIAALPLYNGDLEAAGLPRPLQGLQRGFEGGGPPEPVQDFQRRIEAADALLFACPEYNYSMAGVLKNAIDWGSRPSPAPPRPPLNRKPGAMMGGPARTW